MHAKYLPSDLRVNYLYKLSPFSDFHLISRVLLGLGFELRWFYFVFMVNRKANQTMRLKLLFYESRDNMDCACGLRCRGFPKILWDPWQTNIHCALLQKIVSTKLECVEMYQLRG